MRTKLIKFLLLVLLLVLGVGAYYIFSSSTTQVENIRTAVVERGDIENVVTATGKLEPREYVDVGAQVTGQLHRLHVDIGDNVKKGDLLAEIDVTLFMAKVDQQRAQLNFLKASLEDKKAQNSLAKINFQRQQNLYDHNATSLEHLQNAQFSLQSSNAQVSMLEAQIQQTNSSLRADEANLEFTRIYAPMDGTVVSLSAKQGQTLNANQQAPIILQIADLSTMRVKAEVSEADVTKLRLGMELYFKTIGKNKRWYAKLQKVEPTPTITNNVVLYNALFDANNSSKRLMTSMTTQVFFLLESAKDTLIIPVTAVSKEKMKKRDMGTVHVLLEDGTIQKRRVELGVSNRVYVEVLSGLQEGEKLILKNKKTKKGGRKKDRSKMPRMF